MHFCHKTPPNTKETEFSIFLSSFYLGDTRETHLIRKQSKIFMQKLKNFHLSITTSMSVWGQPKQQSSLPLPESPPIRLNWFLQPPDCSPSCRFTAAATVTNIDNRVTQCSVASSLTFYSLVGFPSAHERVIFQFCIQFVFEQKPILATRSCKWGNRIVLWWSTLGESIFAQQGRKRSVILDASIRESDSNSNIQSDYETNLIFVFI